MELIKTINFFLTLYQILILIRALLSWFNPNYGSPFVQFIVKATEPVLRPARQFIGRLFGYNKMRIDFSPILIFIAIEIIQSLLINLVT
ncbi:MAG: YggT family protein [Candidatus Cloacimonetes bacterium]|nr:YggT family protein [Candidatus Cloacimonadota bacterium]MBS3767605.1 YggT family protein [Candidatus Cloacimonadota bacterium]